MSWFNKVKINVEPSLLEIRTKAALYIDQDYPFFLTSWSEKDMALFFTEQEIIRKRKILKELQGIVDGNSEYYGNFQNNFIKVKTELDSTKHFLELEKEAYNQLYMKYRETEAELYTLRRNVEVGLKELKDICDE